MVDISQNGNQQTIHFGVFDADLRTHELRRQGTRVRLPRQSFQILQILLERPGELVTREEFDVQSKVLSRTRKKLEDLESEVHKLEKFISDK